MVKISKKSWAEITLLAATAHQQAMRYWWRVVEGGTGAASIVTRRERSPSNQCLKSPSRLLMSPSYLAYQEDGGRRRGERGMNCIVAPLTFRTKGRGGARRHFVASRPSSAHLASYKRDNSENRKSSSISRPCPRNKRHPHLPYLHLSVTAIIWSDVGGSGHGINVGMACILRNSFLWCMVRGQI
jgi:hypothetical protein